MSRNVSSSNRVPTFSLGERIRKAREDQGLSQQAFANALGVDRKTLGGWENGKHHPSYGDLMLVSSVADVSLEWLAGDLYRPTSGVVGAVANAKGTRGGTRRSSYAESVFAAA